MRKTFLAIAMISIAILMSGCISEGEDLVDEDPCKEGAMQFSMKVLQTFFDNDFEGFYSLLSDEVFTLEGEGPYSKNEIKKVLEEDDYLADSDFIDYSMKNYTSTYKPRILDRRDIKTEFPGIIDDMKALGWDLGENDFIFSGHETRDGSEGPLWDDVLIFGISYNSGEYEFKAFSG